ncbi:hypothetical protein NL676_033871 [Syzygium grande]|nr:hypothetical protein NL676_033871 [Syzygium grande]
MFLRFAPPLPPRENTKAPFLSQSLPSVPLFTTQKGRTALSVLSLPPSFALLRLSVPSSRDLAPTSLEARPAPFCRPRPALGPKCRCLSSRPNKQRPPPSPRGAHRRLRLVASVRQGEDLLEVHEVQRYLMVY